MRLHPKHTWREVMTKEQNADRGPYKMTASDMKATAGALETYAQNFNKIAAIMEERKLETISVTGVPSVLTAFKRLDGHYLSANESLGFLAVGEPIPRYEHMGEPEKSSLASKKTKRPSKQ